MRRSDSIAFAIGLLILAYIIYSLDPNRVMGVLLKTRLDYFILAAFFYFLNDVTAAISLRMMTSDKISLLEVLVSHMGGMLYSNITPGRLGYYYTSFSIAKKTDTSRSANIGILTLFQGINFFVKVMLCIIAVTYFSSYIVDSDSQNYLLFAAFFPLIGLAFIALVLYTKTINLMLSKVSAAKRLLGYIERMQAATKEVKTEKIIKLLILALFGWFFMSAQWLMLASAIEVDISYLTALMLQPLLTTVMFVPVSPSGLGLAEGGSALLFNASGFTLADGLAFMLLVRINSIAVDAFGLLDSRRRNTFEVTVSG